MKIVKVDFPLNQYVAEETKKNKIIIHHSVSRSAKSSINWWKHTKERIGCAFIIDRDGTIYQCFDPRYWAWALGLKSSNRLAIEKSSIQIELVSLGGLTLNNSTGVFLDAFSIPFTTPNEIIKCKYRGYEYFQNYSEATLEALRELIAMISKQFNIQVQDNIENIFEIDPTVISENKPGIYSHTTFRADKSDIFPQESLVNLLKSLKKEKEKNLTKKEKEN